MRTVLKYSQSNSLRSGTSASQSADKRTTNILQTTLFSKCREWIRRVLFVIGESNFGVYRKHCDRLASTFGKVVETNLQMPLWGECFNIQVGKAVGWVLINKRFLQLARLVMAGDPVTEFRFCSRALIVRHHSD